MKLPTLLLTCALGLLVAATPRQLVAAPRLPADDTEVLLRLNPSLSRPDAAAIRKLRATQRPVNQSLNEALPLVRQLIQLARDEANPRFLHQAQSLLKPWLPADTTSPASRNAEVLLLSATIRQSLHDFDGALTELEEVLRLDPHHGQAWLTRTVIQMVTGAYPAARESCLQAMRFAEPLAATTATAALGGAFGRPEGAYVTLSRALEAAGTPAINADAGSSAGRIWALITLAELADRRGLPELALQHCEAASILAPRDPMVLASHADALLALDRFLEVVDLLRDFEHIDALLLRSAEANQQLARREDERRPVLTRQLEALRDRFAAGHLRGEGMHLRDEARFSLRLEHDPARALELARRNWETQKEWADAQLLIAAAEAMDDKTLANEIRSFVADPLGQSGRQTAPVPTP